MTASYGRVQGAGYLSVSMSQGLRFWDALSMRLNGQILQRDFPKYHADQPEGGIERKYHAKYTLQYDITPEHAVSGRVVFRHPPTDPSQREDRVVPWWWLRDRMNWYVSYRQVVRKGLDVFLIIGDPSAQTWRWHAALKVVFVI